MKIFKMMALAATACFATACANDKTEISGNVTEDVSEITLFSIDPNGTEALDTIPVTNNEFSYEWDMDSADFLLLKVTENYAVPLFVQPGEKVKVELTGNNEDPMYEVSGSKESERILRIAKIRQDAFDKVDSLNTVSQEAQGTDLADLKRAELDAFFQKVVTNTQQRYKDMIDEEPGSIANIFIFSQTLGNFPLISAQEDFAYFEKVDSAIAENYPGLRHTKNFHESIDRIKESLVMQEKMEKVRQGLTTGNDIPEIEMTGPNGTSRKLSDLRGKVVLVDFWAAWCRPCRAQNPFLVNLYNQYNPQGFEIFSVSLDGLPQQQNPREEWLTAIEMDNLVWKHHVSDLKGWDSEVVQQFGFNGIPFTVLVDREGKIIATELRGPELEAKVKEVIGS